METGGFRHTCKTAAFDMHAERRNSTYMRNGGFRHSSRMSNFGIHAEMRMSTHMQNTPLNIYDNRANDATCMQKGGFQDLRAPPPHPRQTPFSNKATQTLLLVPFVGRSRFKPSHTCVLATSSVQRNHAQPSNSHSTISKAQLS